MRRVREWTGSRPALLCVTALIATCGIAAAGSAGAGESPETEAEAADAPTVESIAPEQAAKLGELRRAARADDPMPADWSKAVADAATNGRGWGANPKLARHTAPGVWLVPANGYVCMVSSSPADGSVGFGCASNEDVARGRLAPSDVDADGNGVVTGIVPDGVASVTLVDRDGLRRAAPVERNTYRAAIDADLMEVRFTDAAGASHILPMEWRR